MNNASDRRASRTARVPFDAIVEVGGALGPSFEAQSVNLSEDGISLRTAYLPDVGQPVRCRFDAGQGLVVVAAGEVLWKDEQAEGGEFGVRFTNLDAQSAVALRRIVGMAEDGSLPREPQGRRVRLHIEGLPSAMRARIKTEGRESLTAFSDLAFLQMGKAVELEDATTGDRRPVSIDRVEVELDGESRIPRLVVGLRYTDELADDLAERGDAGAVEASPKPGPGVEHVSAMGEIDVRIADTDRRDPFPARESEGARSVGAREKACSDQEGHWDAEGPGGAGLAGAVAQASRRVGPALTASARTSMRWLSGRFGKASSESDVPIRRITSPPPDGALHASGRRVVRTVAEERAGLRAGLPLPRMTKRGAVVAGSVLFAGAVAVFALRSGAPTPPVASEAAQVQASPLAASSAATLSPGASASPGSPTTPAASPAPAFAPADRASEPWNQGGQSDRGADRKPHFALTPFGNATVARGNVLTLKMDGPIDRIQGAQQPTGFTVSVPGRKSLESGSAFPSRDERVAAAHVDNNPEGAELTVNFRDGVPNYQVRARGDTLEVHLATLTNVVEKSPEAHKKKTKHHTRSPN